MSAPSSFAPANASLTRISVFPPFRGLHEIPRTFNNYTLIKGLAVLYYSAQVSATNFVSICHVGRYLLRAVFHFFSVRSISVLSVRNLIL